MIYKNLHWLEFLVQ